MKLTYILSQGMSSDDLVISRPHLLKVWLFTTSYGHTADQASNTGTFGGQTILQI